MQGSAKTVSSKSRPPSPTTGSSPQACGRLPGRRSHCRFNSGSGELLSRPLNSRDRARARRLACDWLLGRGRRRPRRGARVDLPLPFPQFMQKRAVRRLGTGRRRGCRQVLSSDWLSGCYVRRSPQLPACAVGKNEPRAGEGSHHWSTARAQSRDRDCDPSNAVVLVPPGLWGRRPNLGPGKCPRRSQAPTRLPTIVKDSVERARNPDALSFLVCDHKSHKLT